MNGDASGVSSLGSRSTSLAFASVVAWLAAAATTGPIGIWSAIGGAAVALGLAVLSLVRPHVALMVLVGLGVAMLARPKSRSTFRLTGRIVILDEDELARGLDRVAQRKRFGNSRVGVIRLGRRTSHETARRTSARLQRIWQIGRASCRERVYTIV